MASVLEPDDHPCARPFLSAGEAMAWMDRNCCLCAKADWDNGVDVMPCDIQAQFSMASLCAGRVPTVVLDRAGFNAVAEWQCRELAPATESIAIMLKQRSDQAQRKLFPEVSRG